MPHSTDSLRILPLPYKLFIHTGEYPWMNPSPSLCWLAGLIKVVYIVCPKRKADNASRSDGQPSNGAEGGEGAEGRMRNDGQEGRMTRYISGKLLLVIISHRWNETINLLRFLLQPINWALSILNLPVRTCPLDKWNFSCPSPPGNILKCYCYNRVMRVNDTVKISLVISQEELQQFKVITIPSGKGFVPII